MKKKNDKERAEGKNSAKKNKPTQDVKKKLDKSE